MKTSSLGQATEKNPREREMGREQEMGTGNGYGKQIWEKGNENCANPAQAEMNRNSLLSFS